MTDKIRLDDNLIIHGDNLKALKALLPTYASRVKCIYIDPPYNTGKEGWIYNDNVSGPIIAKWLQENKPVDKEDLNRHEKWLCMMTPRLKLLKELLKQDGAIFISIDDNEYANLRILMDEIFGEQNYVATFIRQGIKGGTGPSDEIRKTHDYVLCFAKNKLESELNGIELDSEILDLIDEKGPYRKGRELNKWGAGSSRADSPTMWFSVQGPKGEEVYPIRNDGSEGRWRWGKRKMLDAVSKKEVIFEPRENGTYIVFEKVRDNNPRRKAFSTLELTNAEGTEELKAIFKDKSPFNYPKPPELVKFLTSLTSNEDDDIILDSFAGSGTTAQAVLELNKEDGGNRKFILVEMEDYADTITAERVRRVIKGIPTAKNKLVKAGLGGTFSYFDLGEAIEMESLLNGTKLPSYLEMARYLYYTATGEEFVENNLDEASHVIGESKDYKVLAYYKPDLEYLKTTALTLDEARLLRTKCGTKPLLVFAPTKYIEANSLDELKITFCQLPYEIYRMKK
jgi:adenine-specific DNA-methyltransferase